MTEDSMHRTLHAALARNSGPSAEDVEALAEVLAMLPTCTQCGKPFSGRACGIAHAIIASDPLRHRAFGPLLAAHTAAAKREGARAVVEAVDGVQPINHVSGWAYATEVLAAAREAAARFEGGA